MEKRCKFDFITTAGHTWINKQHLLNYIANLTRIKDLKDVGTKQDLTKLIKEIEKCQGVIK